MQHTIESSGFQLLVSNSLLFCFKSNNGFIFKMHEVQHLMKKHFSRGK